METQILKHPEIIYPFGSGSLNSNDYTFVRDLSLDALLNSVPFHRPETRCLAHRVLTVDLDTDDATVKYRQDALEELIRNQRLREGIEESVNGFRNIDRALDNFRNYHADLEHGLALLRTYRDLIQNLPHLGDAVSKAVSSVASYLNNIKSSREFSELCEFVAKIEHSVGVDFRVSLDKDGVPLNMYGLKLVEKDEGPRKPLFERIFGGKKSNDTQEKNLRDYGDRLNRLGEIVKEYLDNKFVSVIKSHVPQIEEVTQLLGPFDFYCGFANYFVQLRERGFEISRPALLSQTERRMKVTNARNPLLMEARNNGHKVVPNDIEYNGKTNLFVITGPNNGGKTTYVKTVGLIQLMAQSGLFVPARSAEVSFVDGIYTHFVAPDDITKGEGRYRNELRRMKDIFGKATPYSLVILDEPCGGTSYEEGQRQSLVLLDGFHKLGAATYFTTHMHPLTKEVDNGRYPAGRNFQVECADDREKLSYTYRLIPGSSGKSYGEEIAREIGVRPENIAEVMKIRAEQGGYQHLLRTVPVCEVKNAN